MKISILVTVLVCATGAVSAQDKAPVDPMSKETKQLYTAVKGYILRSAEKMPEEKYSFKPGTMPEVRNYGAILGHIADDQYFFCGAAKGETKETSIEKTVTSKAALIDELKKAFAYCDALYDSATDAKFGTIMKFGGNQRSLGGILNFNVAHDFEHYGNIITYLRSNNIVPPSSEKQ